MYFDDTQNPGNSREPQDSRTPPQPPEQPAMHNVPDFNVPLYNPYPQKKKGSGWKIFWGIVITLSILANGLMFLMLIGMGTILAAGSGPVIDDGIVENVLVRGSYSRKIAVVNVGGIIDERMSDWVRRQIDKAEADDNVRAIIVRIVSPGGAVSSSDQIHYYINRFKERTDKPVLGFMQSVAASGGYYSAVACDEIMAEPTVITGSIGVIMNYMVLKGLLEDKLGINPVTIKSGKHKDWPSMFTEVTDEQRQYLSEKLITPAFDRFVKLVAEGRQEVLTEDQVRQLADGSIFSAPQALEKKLIDEIGYFDDAVDRVQQMAQITDAHVVEYQERFSLWYLLNAKTHPRLDLESQILEYLAAPRLLYLWDGKE
jgi:protease-4